MVRSRDAKWARNAGIAATMLLSVIATFSGCAGRTETNDSEPTPTNSTAPHVVEGAEESDGLTALSCMELFNEFHGARIDLTDQAARECIETADCTVAEYGATCFASCGHRAAVATLALEPSGMQVQALEERYCAASMAQRCAHVPLPCGPILPRTVECVDGTCSLMFGD